MSVLEIAAQGAELLDDRFAPPPTVRESLRNIARANRWFGGAWAVRFALGQALDRLGPGSYSLLDVGTGSGDLPLMARSWAARRGVELRTFGLEVNRVAAGMARANGVTSLVADAGVLPLPDASVDFVLLSQVAHHFSAPAIVRLLRECARVARRALLIADLRRSPAARWSFPMVGRLLRFDPVTIQDGVTSLRRGFTVSSFRDLLDRAGITATVTRRPGARLVAIASLCPFPIPDSPFPIDANR
jgi:ubiquinone/menaquinone biosynthesis C-methylase UbiE